jgi:chaperone required for assembly of F1-ATPase
MNLDKSTKRIAKRVKKGFQGYPQISLAYFGTSVSCASEVVVGFILEEGADVQEQKFTSKGDARKDETIQTTLLKVIERADAKTVSEVDGVTLIK